MKLLHIFNVINETGRWNYSTFSMLSTKQADETTPHFQCYQRNRQMKLLHIFNVINETCRWNYSTLSVLWGLFAALVPFPSEVLVIFRTWNADILHRSQDILQANEKHCSYWWHYIDILTAGKKTMLTHILWSQSHIALHFTRAWYSSTEAHQEDTEMDKIIISNVYSDTGTCTRWQERQANKTMTDRQSCRTSLWSCGWHRRQNL